jgi:eukaryotic-like serine/threonine-protein kinase
LSSTLSSPTKSDLPKSLFGFDIVERIGEGAASSIYAVSDPKSRQLYALKHVIRRTEKDDRFIDQLQNEFRVSENFRHPGLRRCVDLKINRTLFRKILDAALIMELVDGLPLNLQPMKEIPDVIAIFKDVANALSALHYQQFVHCDTKPNNILTDHSNHTKVIDFGQACRQGTVKERVQGTPDFIAPEQVKLRPVTMRTDVFNYGATLYWALTGQKMPTLFTIDKKERDIVRELRFPSPRELNPMVSENISDLVMECVQMDPVRRPAGMSAILGRLDMG